MFADLMNSIPSIKNSILYIFETYFGIKLDLTNFTLDQDNNLFVQLTNIKLEPNIINNNYLKNINIKITKGSINNLELKVGINTLEINLSKVSLTLMPVITINKEKEEKKEEKKIIEEKKEEINNNIDNNDGKEQKGIISSFIDYYLSKLKISIDEIELIAFNYEITNKNLTLANPVICFNIYKIKYDKGKIKESLDKTYIRKTIWENKHFSIDAFCLKICKSYNAEEKDINKSDVSNDKNKYYDVENNDNIMVINTEKGIHIFTNTKNEIIGDIGEIQLIINLFQLELFKNFIDSYMTYLTLGKNKEAEKKITKAENQINIPNKNKNINYTSNINKSVINNQSNNEIMNLKLNLSSLSLVVLERNQNPTEVKLNEYSKEKMNEHFCYFEENFFIFILYNLCIQYTNKKQLTSLTIEEIGMNYIEYNSKEKKEEEIELIKRTGSESSNYSETGIFKSNEIFRSITEDGINVKEFYCSYDYRYNKNQILLVKNIKMEFIKGEKDKDRINFELNSIVCNFHPIYFFKVLKLLYENAFLIKEVLFYNLELINEENKIKNGNNKPDENILIENNNNGENQIKKENGDNLNLSFLSFEESEIEDNKNSKQNNNNETEENKISNIIYQSDLLFNPNNPDNKYKPEEKLNQKIKNILNNLTFEIKIRVIELKIFSFKCEENFYNIINPFFNEFYYEHIYIMDIKDDFKQQKLKINEISSKDYFSIMIKNINIKNTVNENTNELLILKFHPLIISFSNNKILECSSDSFPVKYDLEKNEILVNFKINIFFKVKLFPYILSFVNIWKYTLLLFDIFKQRMIFNFDKGKAELEQMNFEKNILKYIEDNRNKKLNKEDLIEYNINNNINITNENLLNIEIKIPLIKIEFDIIMPKIKSCVNIKNVGLKYVMNNMLDVIEFSINEITSKEFDFNINSISLNLTMSKIKAEKNDLNLQKIKPKKHKKKLNFNIVSPGESIEIYIENILRFKAKQKSLEQYSDTKSLETKIDINISIKSIKIKPVEAILFLNDIYNVIGREEIYNNSNNEKNKMLLSKSMQRISSSSYGSTKSKNKMELIASKQKSISLNSNDKNKKNDGDLFNINFNIESIKCTINDDSTFRTTELSINNINLKNKIFNIKTIELFILYEIEDFGEKVLVNLSKINDINLSITEKENNNFSYNITISSIILSLCKDSFIYIENLLDIVSNIISNCFVQTKKGNKIVITQKKDKLLGMRDTKLEDEQELEVFGDDEAKSVCLISAKNDFVLEIDDNYLDNLLNEKEEVVENIDEIFKSNLREKKEENDDNNKLDLCIKKIEIGLYSGLDFESIDDIKCKSDGEHNNKNKEIKEEKNIELIIEKDKEEDINENINIKKELDENKIKKKDSNFEIIEFNPYKKINGREKDNFLLFNTEEINLSILYVQKNSYEIEFGIKNFEIIDNLRDSKFKRLLFPSKYINIQNDSNVEIQDEKNDQKFLSIFVDISNSQNELSANNYSDFNIICEISLSSIHLKIHQNALLFLLNFFIQNDKERTYKKNNKENSALKLYNTEQYHTERAFIEDIEFNEIILDDLDANNQNDQNDLLVDRNFFYITNFIFRKFNVNITYESSELGFSFNNIYIPIIPDLKNYDFPFNEIKYKGFVTVNQFTDFFVEHFFGQLSKSNIVFQLLKSLSWTQPIFNIFGDFFDIFISPFQSYRKNQGFMHGLFKGIKKFFFNLLSNNVYVGEKMIRTLTTFIGVTKSNNIGKDSFYERYILTDEKKKIYDYFYK